MRQLARLIVCGFALVCVGCLICLLTNVAAAQTRPQTAAPATMNSALPTLWLIGDSTVKNGQDTGNNGQWGWGNPISAYFDHAKINVQNRALGGTSSRTFQTQGLWDRVLTQVKAGDWVIMQFGHNDSGPLDDAARARGTLPGNGDETKEIDNPITKKHEVVHTYGWYIRKYIADARVKGATAIVCSPIPRNSWANGKVNRNKNYTLWASQAAKGGDTPFVNLDEIICVHYDALGQQKVTDEYFPVGETTHTDWAGAILNAQCVIEGLRGLDHCELVKFLEADPPKEIALPMGKAR